MPASLNDHTQPTTLESPVPVLYLPTPHALSSKERVSRTMQEKKIRGIYSTSSAIANKNFSSTHGITSYPTYNYMCFDAIIEKKSARQPRTFFTFRAEGEGWVCHGLRPRCLLYSRTHTSRAYSSLWLTTYYAAYARIRARNMYSTRCSLFATGSAKQKSLPLEERTARGKQFFFLTHRGVRCTLL